MSLTKKHFKAIAEILREMTETNIKYPEDEFKLIQNEQGILLIKFCEWFKSENPLFDEQKFRDAVLKD